MSFYSMSDNVDWNDRADCQPYPLVVQRSINSLYSMIKHENKIQRE